MTTIKVENIKCELNEDDTFKSFNIKFEDVRCKCGSEEGYGASVKHEPEELDHGFPEFQEATGLQKKYSRPPPKTPAERKRAQREREKLLKQKLGLIRVRGPPKTAAERKRAQREREKQMRMQIDLMYPKCLEKLPGESRKERVERERQLKIELGLIRPKGRPKTAAERKRAQREREKQLKLELGLVGLRSNSKDKCLHKEKEELTLEKPPPKTGAERMREYRLRKRQQQIHLGLSRLNSFYRASSQERQHQLRKELKPLSTNTTNVPVLKPAEWCKEEFISKSKFPSEENVEPLFDLEFVDCSKVSSTDNSSVDE